MEFSAPPAYAAKNVGGHLFTMTRIGVLSLAKVMGASGVVMGFIIGVPYAAVMALVGIVGAGGENGAAAGAVGIGMAVGVLIFAPVFYGVFMFVFGLIYGVVINLVFRIAGGLEIELQ